jgi:ribosomal protein S12 methylthiotransferase
VGFPGETDEDFETLLNFLEETQFERVGAFTYSPQEGTRAAALDDDVPESTKRQRLERLVELQRLITADRYEARVGRTTRAIVDAVHRGVVEARTIWQADDIDGLTRIARTASHPALRAGSLVEVKVERVVDDYDFDASLVRVVSGPAAPPARSRALPVMSSTVGSYGR